MRILETYKNFKFKVGDIILIEYWYCGMVCPVKILEKKGRKFLVSHNVENSNIRNAPDEWIKSNEIIDHHR